MLRKALMVACAAASLVAGYNQAHAETWAQTATRMRQHDQSFKDTPINWVFASQAQDGSGRYYYDSNSVIRDGFTYLVMRVDKPNGYEMVAKMQLDCSDLSFRFLYGFEMLPNGTKGRSDSEPTEWKYFTADSNIGYIAQDVC